MTKLAIRRGKPSRYRLSRGNHMTFPRELRDAIPDLPAYAGRVLQLDSMSGDQSVTDLFGPRVHLRLLAKETGKLKGEFPVLIDLEPEAARRLADILRQLADQAEPTHSKM